jgi:hypothetical protein
VDAVETECGREVLVEVAKRVKQARVEEDEASSVGSTTTECAGHFTWKLQTNGSPSRTYSFTSESVVTIGQPGYRNDVELSNERGGPVCSRVHAVIIPLTRQLVICDVGSTAGFELTHRNLAARQSGLALPQPHRTSPDISVPGARRPLLVDANEAAILVLRPLDCKVVINPKECIVCLARPREVAFECGHFVTCDACSGRVLTCPVCRSAIHRPALVRRTQSFMPQAGQGESARAAL